MSEKNTGVGHDDDGNVDDKRIAGWVCVAAAIGLAAASILVKSNPPSVDIVRAFLLAGVGLLGATVAEKFKRG
ncbi:MAG TPA: hypothetical protein VKP88_01975 [Candidatus Paceibacterota bacterium]|nr:hypothetical protein [Candidatus Paceibacterota bacterium]